MHADRANRVLLTFIGLLALGLGTAGLLAAGGVFGHTFQHRRLLDNQFSTYFSDHGEWLWPAIAAVAFVIMLLCLIWLLRLLFSTDRVGDITVPTSMENQTGRTTLRPSALTQAVSQEIETYHGVRSARARVLGDPLEPTLAIDVTANLRADLPALVQRIEREALTHARQALDRPDLPVKLGITVTEKGTTHAA
jgi:hypothetical protein